MQPSLRGFRGQDFAGTASVAAGVLLLHLLTTQGYGIFRDELYYLACGEHLDLGYVDHPPLVAFAAAAVRSVLGESLLALRLLPALCAAATAAAAGWIAAGLGGNRFASTLAALCAGTAPVYLSLFSIFSMNAFDVLLWSLALGVAVRALGGGDPRLWLAFGALAGVGLENKLSFLFLGVGVALGLCLARRWDVLRSPWLWAGGGISALLFAPHVAWQLLNDWPTLEFVANVTRYKNLALSPPDFLSAQLLQMNPLSAPLWAGGLAALLGSRRLEPWRALGFAWLVVLGILLLNAAKPYYLAASFPILYAAGAVAFEAWLEQRRAWPGLRPAVLAALLASAAVLAPLAKPLLAEDELVAHMDRLGLSPTQVERGQLGRLPQLFADMHGWPELAQATARVFHALPPVEQSRACVYAGNYGEAGAIDFFGPALGLPKAISGHNSYHLWGPRGCDGSVVLVLGGPRAEHVDDFESLELGATHTCRDCMPYESELPIWIGRGLRLPLASVWPATRRFQ